MSAVKEMQGQRFGMLLVKERAQNNGRGLAMWLCQCDCGRQVVVSGANLRNGLSKSCGCVSSELTAQRNFVHGASRRGDVERLYRVWRGMVGRCYDPKNNSFRWYGERGIGVCDEWRNSYPRFKEWAVNNGYNADAKRGECTIDRIDANQGYSPSNCRWVSMAEQNKNRRKAR